jgi:malate dehydrogenase (oxaloacetate-decarboxylating)
MEKSFGALRLGDGDVDIIVCSDGSIQTAERLAATYSVAAGIRPDRVVPVSLDAGTDTAFIKRYVETATRMFPRALLHFEDFCPHGDDYRVFTAAVHGRGALVMAAVYSANRVMGIPMKHQTVVVFGAGCTGVGIADHVRQAMATDGATDEQARSQIWLVDHRGLLFDDTLSGDTLSGDTLSGDTLSGDTLSGDTDDLSESQATYAKNRSDELWAPRQGPVGLAETIEAVTPTILIGTSSLDGAFTRRVVRAMCHATDRPLILPISRSPSTMEAMPSDIIAWSDGKALVAVGAPVEPFDYRGTRFSIGQLNDVLIFPGLGLGVIVSGASRVTSPMLQAAARAVAEQADGSQPGVPLLPGVEHLRGLSVQVAEATVRAAVDDRVAGYNPTDVSRAVRGAMWSPE